MSGFWEVIKVVWPLYFQLLACALIAMLNAGCEDRSNNGANSPFVEYSPAGSYPKYMKDPPRCGQMSVWIDRCFEKYIVEGDEPGMAFNVSFPCDISLSADGPILVPIDERQHGLGHMNGVGPKGEAVIYPSLLKVQLHMTLYVFTNGILKAIDHPLNGDYTFTVKANSAGQ